MKHSKGGGIRQEGKGMGRREETKQGLRRLRNLGKEKGEKESMAIKEVSEGDREEGNEGNGMERRRKREKGARGM